MPQSRRGLNYLIRWVDDAAEEPAAESPGFTNPTIIDLVKEPTMSGDDTKLEEREASLAKREQALRHTENTSFVEGLVDSNKLLPVQKAGAIALLDQLSVNADVEISFSVGDEEKKIGSAQLFKISCLPSLKLSRWAKLNWAMAWKLRPLPLLHPMAWLLIAAISKRIAKQSLFKLNIPALIIFLPSKPYRLQQISAKDDGQEITLPDR